MEYQYIADNVLRKREKPFADQEFENVLIWIHDNFHAKKMIDSMKIKFDIQNNFDNSSKILAYPEKFSLVNLNLLK